MEEGTVFSCMFLICDVGIATSTKKCHKIPKFNSSPLFQMRGKEDVCLFLFGMRGILRGELLDFLGVVERFHTLIFPDGKSADWSGLDLDTTEPFLWPVEIT